MSHYGRSYRQRRAELPDPFGLLCPFCRLPMLEGQRLQTDHMIPARFGGADSPLRWSHGKCNEAAGARIGNTTRSRRQGPRWAGRWA